MKRQQMTTVLLLLIAIQASAQGWRVYKSDGTEVDFSYAEVNSLVAYEASEHIAIDLGLPSGTKWATCNVGASCPEDFGDYFAWGEITTKGDYSWSTYAPGGSSVSSSSACGSSVDLICQEYGNRNGWFANIAGTQYDVAHMKWGGKWMMPTHDQQQELSSNCAWTWTTLNGVNGYNVVGPNGSSIFLPAAGYHDEESFSRAGMIGLYWSSTLAGAIHEDSYCLYIQSNYRNADNNATSRCHGLSVRPVLGFETIPLTTYDLAIIATGSGAVSLSGSTIRNSTHSFSVNAGTSHNITITPDNGYRIKTLKVNGSTVISSYSSSYQYTVSNISANTTVAVEFEAIPVTTYTLGISVTGSGYVSYGDNSIRNTTRSYSVNAGSSPYIYIVPDNGYRIKTVKKNGSTVISSYSSSYQYMVSNITANTTVAVEFEAIPVTTYDLTINVKGNGYVAYNGSSFRNDIRSYTVNAGASPIITITPDTGHQIKSLKTNGSTVVSSYTGSYQYTVSNISENTTVAVEFEEIPTKSFTLTITATGYGSVTYYRSDLANTVRNGSQSFQVSEGESATIYFTPDATCQINYVKVNGSDRTAFVYSNKYTVSTISANTTVEVEFTGGTKAFTYQGINYNVSSFDDKTILLAKGSYGKLLDVPAKLTYQGAEWTVTGIEADALDGNQDLAAVVWRPNAPFTASASNPNLLLYVNDVSYAKTTIRNVVADGTAQNIILTDAASGNDFYCPQRFVAQNISYTHQYNMETGIGEARGWETIALPFDVQKVTHESKGQVVPFAAWRSDITEKPFWLMLLDNSGWKEADAIKANTPYIISMPNNESYMPQYLLNGAVTFSSENVAIEKTENMHTGTYNGRTFTPTFAEVGMGDGAFELNVSNELETNISGAIDGSRFVLNLRKVHPFEAYMTTSTRGTRSIDISDGMGVVTDSGDGQPIRIYNMKGMLMRSATEDGSIEEMKRTLPAGVYIINRRKVIVK